MAEYKTFKKEKNLYFLLSFAAYFVPFTVVTACLFPFVKSGTGSKIAMGLGLVVINAIPFLMGVFKAFFAHFPMLNVLAFVFIALGAFFTFEIFARYVEYFMWIELAAGIGSVASCIFWGKYRKYKQYSLSVAATVKSGAFKKRGE